VNDNMPFLFDSVIGEVTDSAGEPALVQHPVMLVRHDGDGVAEILGDSSAKAGRDADRVSLIHIHVPRLTDEEASALSARLSRILAQVRAAVSDWKPMLKRLDGAVSDLSSLPVPLAKEDVTEAVAFLKWLREDNFVFLGMRKFRYSGEGDSSELVRSEKKGLGILADPDIFILRRGNESVATTPEIREFLHGPDPLIVTKANTRSVVHRRSYLDYVGVKTFGKDGRLTGELRIVGLFTSTAYTRSVLQIPFIRSKARAVIGRLGYDPADHSGKALLSVLESYPRDELFQIDVPTLTGHAQAILALGERPRIRVLLRADRFDRFVSAIVFVPRDRYDSPVRVRIGEMLREAFEGRVSAFYPAFPEGSLARVHFIIGRSGGKPPAIDARTLEAAIRDIVRTWDDALREAVNETGVDPALGAIAARFPESYRNSFPASIALMDADVIRTLSAENPIAIDFYEEDDAGAGHAGLKIYHHGEPVPLSRRVPLLENMGFHVISERTFEIGDDERVFLHDMEIETADGTIDLRDQGALFEEVFLSVWKGESDNDTYNTLAERAGLASPQIRILRAYGRYLQQAGIPQSQDFIASVLNRYPGIARDLLGLFSSRLDPNGDRDEAHHVARIEDALADVPSLDDDTIIRRYLNLVTSTLRTNYYAPAGARPVSLALKLDSRNLAGLPAPRPWREIFVYGPEVEGVHLRFGPVARGGLRWSDRAQDYRTEVLGLVKAQQVKNAVIVPVGAKGGFFPKKLPAGGSREAVFEAGKGAYVNFVASLLSVTDNLVDGKVVPPEGVVRHDGDDPYFVVAADKGTASFSDTANEISQSLDFWLDDAFASGGSAGYDHKEMGITAKGAWEAVKRHFREMNRDIQTEPFTVAGVGDMSGDVFGNGMLLSPQIRLLAAFDHRDIFIDPNPDPARSLAERRRLFEMPRSSWQDYDRTALSEGGMIVPRTQKYIDLSPEAAAAIGMEKVTATPFEIMNAILKAQVDLLWFGGIGTYVRASNESDAAVGDRANDAIRVAGAELRALVVGEGANLGMTQLGRIEYGLKGGRCNSDAIDNSAGVNSSDIEVNVKIALAAAMRRGSLDRPARNRLLEEMTGEVERLVLANNYQQTLAISLTERRGLSELVQQGRMMDSLVARGLLDREVEFLPGPLALAQRAGRGEPLTRAEIGVLLAYAKIVLFDDLLASPLPDEPYFEHDLFAHFPKQMRETYAEEIKGHRLRREIVATELCNDVVNRGGPSFINSLTELTGRAAHEVAAAYVVVREGFGLPGLFAEIDALDSKMDGQKQIELYQRVVDLIRSATVWMLRNEHRLPAVGEAIAALVAARRELEPALADIMPEGLAAHVEADAASLREAGVPEPLANRVSRLDIAALIPDIAFAAQQAGSNIRNAARAFFAVGESFRISRMEQAAGELQPVDYYDGLALARAVEQIGQSRRGIVVAALKAASGGGDAVEHWIEAGGSRVETARERLRYLTEGNETSVSRLSVAAGVMADLASQ